VPARIAFSGFISEAAFCAGILPLCGHCREPSIFGPLEMLKRFFFDMKVRVATLIYTIGLALVQSVNLIKCFILTFFDNPLKGYLGAMGAFLQHSFKRSFYENFTSAVEETTTTPAYGVLDMARDRLVPFPKLRSHSKYLYTPDTFLLNDPILQREWLDMLDSRTDTFLHLARQWHPQDKLFPQRADAFANLFRKHLDTLRYPSPCLKTLV
jgi:hypothetical protein